jgi:cobyrinic acid a,c-diamide synthase
MSISFQIPRICISAPKGGAGKTVFTLGLIHYLNSKGFRVAPFKKGPDYIDAGWLGKVAEAPCRNLDLFLFSEELNLYSFYRGARASDIAIIEGNRGLFDGLDVEGSCSTASLAKLLKAPVIMVLDCTKATRSMAALLKGFLEFDPEVQIKGVVLNHIVRARHENIIRSAIERYTGVPVLGVIPRLKNAVKERHLGLITAWEREAYFLEELNASFQENLDLNTILSLAQSVPELKIPEQPEPESRYAVKVGIFLDPAFQFYYPENLEYLEALGAELIFVNSLEDYKLPEVDALYLGGGFPEIQAERLAENVGLRKEVRRAVESGMPVYAECGGLMYLGEEIKWQGKKFPMTGVLPIKYNVDKKPHGHGYVMARVVNQNPYFETDTLIKGHEFHYSYPEEVGEKEGMKFIFELEKGSGFDGKRDGVSYKNLLASYTHIHIFSVKYWAERFLGLAEKFKNT